MRAYPVTPEEELVNIVEMSKEAEPQRDPVRVTFHVKSDQDTVACTVHGWQSNVTAQQVVDATKDYILVQLHHAMTRRGQKIQRWWAEDEFGNIVDARGEYTPPRRTKRKGS